MRPNLGPVAALAAVVAVAAVATSACSSPKGQRAAPTASARASASVTENPGATAIAGFGEASRAWRTCDADAAYGELRRAAARAEPFFRAFAKMSADVVYGPPRPSDEGAGALGIIDAAIGARDCASIERQRAQIAAAVTLGGEEVRGSKRSMEVRAAQAASNAAYELGLALLEARTSTSAHDVGRRGEALGLAEGVAIAASFGLGAEASAPARAAVDEIADAIRGKKTFGELAGRARLARATGAVGLAIRTAARGAKLEVQPPYRRAPADASISALDLPPPRTPLDPELVALGAKLFRDARLSKASSRSCASCHDPARAFSEARRAPTSLDVAVTLPRNTPTLLYSGLHATQLWDGRIVTLESQALRVVHTKAELGLDDAELTARVAADPAYVAALTARALPVDAKSIGKALGAYAASLGAGTSPVDAFAKGDDAALTPELSRGLDVFVGKGRCARCHVPPLWGGSRPTDFAVAVYAVVGAPKAPGSHELDPDVGRFGVTHRDKDKYAFKTPTVRDVARTAPYLHHGGFATLEEVVDLYDKGGARGAGIELEDQDPDVVPLKLTPEERAALLAFLRDGLRDKDQ